MSVIARRIRAAPERSAVEVWSVILCLIAQDGSDVKAELDSITGIAASIIADETPKESPIVVAGNGPRLRIYCIYGEGAITGENYAESEITWNPTEGDWKMWLPVSEDDLEWVNVELSKYSNHVVAYNPDCEEPASDTRANNADVKLSINREVFKRP